MSLQMSGMSIYFVYMLRCIDGTFSTGVTNDINRRYAEHCAGYDQTSYTHTRRPLRLAYVGGVLPARRSDRF